MQKVKLILYALLVVVFSCNNKHETAPLTEVMHLKEMSDLATTEYVVTKIIKANDNKTWFKVGDRKILMSCKASLIAGIDLSSITDNNIKISNKEIHLSLPHAKLISLNIKPEDIKTEYEEVSAFRSPFSASEKNALAVQGESNIRNSVDSLGVLQTAEVNATLFLSSFLQKLGYEKISITYDKPVSSLK